MIREIVKDPVFLSVRSLPAGPDDLAIGQDLRDTLLFLREQCVGLAANMIGFSKQIIAFDDQGTIKVMYNPEIIQTSVQKYETEEGCLSLTGTRPTIRYEKIKVRYQNERFQTRIQTFRGFTAQIIQHEIDHCQGILI